MIDGVHSIIYSSDAEADRAFLRDVLEFWNIDVGGGWLVYAMPPSELAVHPAPASGRSELFFMVSDISAFIEEMTKREVSCTPIHEEAWGRLVRITLPSGMMIGVYEPLHERATDARTRLSR